MGFWHWVVLANAALCLGISAVLDGKPKLDMFGNPAKHSFAVMFVNVACQLAVLYFGGFFK